MFRSSPLTVALAECHHTCVAVVICVIDATNFILPVTFPSRGYLSDAWIAPSVVCTTASQDITQVPPPALEQVAAEMSRAPG